MRRGHVWDSLWKTRESMNTILAPLDFSPVSTEVLATARELAKALEARIVLLHVVPPPVIMTAYGMATSDMSDFLAGDHAQARERLAHYRAELEKQGLQVTDLVVQGPAVDSILLVAEEQKANMLVLGSHGHGGLYEFLVGSTTRGILRACQYPVVLVPAKKESRAGDFFKHHPRVKAVRH
jgi:nucleotide-binding universal stress UspA family protein